MFFSSPGSYRHLCALVGTISQHPDWDRALAFPLVPAALLRCGDVNSSQVLVQLQEPHIFKESIEIYVLKKKE